MTLFKVADVWLCILFTIYAGKVYMKIHGFHVIRSQLNCPKYLLLFAIRQAEINNGGSVFPCSTNRYLSIDLRASIYQYIGSFE